MIISSNHKASSFDKSHDFRLFLIKFMVFSSSFNHFSCSLFWFIVYPFIKYSFNMLFAQIRNFVACDEFTLYQIDSIMSRLKYSIFLSTNLSHSF